MERSMQLYRAAMSRGLACAQQEMLQSVQEQLMSLNLQQTLANQQVNVQPGLPEFPSMSLTNHLAIKQMPMLMPPQTALQQPRDKEEESKRTLFCGNLDSRVSRDILFKVFLPAGSIAKVYIPRSTTGNHRGIAFIVYEHKRSVPLAFEICKGLKLFGKSVRIEPHKLYHCRQQQEYDQQGPHNQATAGQEEMNGGVLSFVSRDCNSTCNGGDKKQNHSINQQNDDEDDKKNSTLYFSNLDGSVPESLLYEIFVKAGPVDIMSVTKDYTGKQRTYGFVTYKNTSTVPLALERFAELKLFDMNVSFKKDEADKVKQKRGITI